MENSNVFSLFFHSHHLATGRLPLFAVVVAAFSKTRLLYRGYRILLPEVHNAVIEYADRLRRGDAEHADDEAPPEVDLSLGAPPSLADALLPVSFDDVGRRGWSKGMFRDYFLV